MNIKTDTPDSDSSQLYTPLQTGSIPNQYTGTSADQGDFEQSKGKPSAAPSKAYLAAYQTSTVQRGQYSRSAELVRTTMVLQKLSPEQPGLSKPKKMALTKVGGEAPSVKGKKRAKGTSRSTNSSRVSATAVGLGQSPPKGGDSGGGSGATGGGSDDVAVSSKTDAQRSEAYKEMLSVLATLSMLQSSILQGKNTDLVNSAAQQKAAMAASITQLGISEDLTNQEIAKLAEAAKDTSMWDKAEDGVNSAKQKVEDAESDLKPLKDAADSLYPEGLEKLDPFQWIAYGVAEAAYYACLGCFKIAEGALDVAVGTLKGLDWVSGALTTLGKDVCELVNKIEVIMNTVLLAIPVIGHALAKQFDDTASLIKDVLKGDFKGLLKDIIKECVDLSTASAEMANQFIADAKDPSRMGTPFSDAKNNFTSEMSWSNDKDASLMLASTDVEVDKAVDAATTKIGAFLDKYKIASYLDGEWLQDEYKKGISAILQDCGVSKSSADLAASIIMGVVVVAVMIAVCVVTGGAAAPELAAEVGAEGAEVAGEVGSEVADSTAEAGEGAGGNASTSAEDADKEALGAQLVEDAEEAVLDSAVNPVPEAEGEGVEGGDGEVDEVNESNSAGSSAEGEDLATEEDQTTEEGQVKEQEKTQETQKSEAKEKKTEAKKDSKLDSVKKWARRIKSVCAVLDGLNEINTGVSSILQAKIQSEIADLKKGIADFSSISLGDQMTSDQWGRVSSRTTDQAKAVMDQAQTLMKDAASILDAESDVVSTMFKG